MCHKVCALSLFATPVDGCPVLSHTPNSKSNFDKIGSQGIQMGYCECKACLISVHNSSLNIFPNCYSDCVTICVGINQALKNKIIVEQYTIPAFQVAS